MASADSSSLPPLKVLLVGTGALGSIYAWRLQNSGQAEVTAVCRSNYDIVSSKGFSIVSEQYGTHQYRPHRVIRQIGDAEEEYDFVIVCTKALPNLGDTSDLIEPVVRSPKTAIILIQNGIGIEDPYLQRYPDNPVVSGVAYIDASQPSAGQISHGVISTLMLGNSQAARQADLGRLSELWNSQGIPCQIVGPNIQAVRWYKLVWNASFNTVSVVSGGYDTRRMLNDPLCRQLIRSIMEEVYRLGETVLGHPLPVHGGIDGPEAYIRYTEDRPSTVWPSMLMDFKAHRPMEHAVILGRPIEIARELGVSVPHMETVHALLTMVEKTYLSHESSN
ncbi:hypothetical protein GGI07_004951 [Coemansia sp. Benny D115]|nr:hypothetical protein GGI07_004951 [Coemansia sp. Benny D115]